MQEWLLHFKVKWATLPCPACSFTAESHLAPGDSHSVDKIGEPQSSALARKLISTFADGYSLS